MFTFTLCSNLGNGTAGTPTCPNSASNGGTVTRTVTGGANNFLALADQNLTAGDFAGVLRIIRAGDAYANVHSQRFPNGEVRAQLGSGDRGDR